MSRSIVLAAAFTACVFTAAASDKIVKKVTTSQTSPSSGQEMFRSYCSSCHGVDGKGNGPAASALRKTPADLTILAARNNGKFPELHVYSTIQGDSDFPAHGSKDMPVWGNVFQTMSHGSQPEVQMRISNLVHFIKEMQTK